eukprot:GHVU01023504.1.p1 GENE.GHVU01023504.1~~GHVU01023504.1.p1  ORF type:complete len:231 (-),score=34.77 GHVU01023504.1:1369-2061(-)
MAGKARSDVGGTAGAGGNDLGLWYRFVEKFLKANLGVHNQFELDQNLRAMNGKKAPPGALYGELQKKSWVSYDPKFRTYRYRSIYEGISSEGDLYQAVKAGMGENQELGNQFLGMHVTAELLERDPNMKSWIKLLMENRRIIAVRTGKADPCTFYEKGKFCDPYEFSPKRKCTNCQKLEGMTLYIPYPGTEMLHLSIDEETKTMWKEIDVDLNEVLQYNNVDTRQLFEAE